ncbi:MAG: S8 family serine peptidase, partial [Thermoplasmata archaeon]
MYVDGDGNNGAPLKTNPTIQNKNDLNNNKIQDSLEEELNAMNATDTVNVFVMLAPRDENFIKFAENYGAKIDRFYTIIDTASLIVPVENIITIASYPAVELIYENEEFCTRIDTSIPAMSGDKNTLRNAGFDVDGSGITIALLDTGIDASRSSLKTLPNGNPKVVGWKDFVSGKSQPYDDVGHGTTMSSIAAAVGRSPYYAGVAPGAQLVMAKGIGTSGGPKAVYDALQWLLDNKNNFGGIDIFSMSIGTPYNNAIKLDGTDTVDIAVEKLVSAGIVAVICAGNEGPASGTIGVPGRTANIITIGAVDDNLNICSFSSRGPTLDGRIKPDLCAVGDRIYTSPSGSWTSGTSEATPHVAGTIALLLQHHNIQLDKYNSASAKSSMTLSPATIKNILIKSLYQPSKGGSYPNNNYGNGIVNIKNTLSAMKSKNYLPMAQFTTSSTLATGISISFDASGSIDPNGDTLTYAWDFGDGTTASGKTTTHTYSTAKEYTITLTVKDSKNNANDFGVSTSIVSQLTTIKKSLNIITGNTPPTAKISVNGEDIVKGSTLIFSRNEVINLDASKSSDTDGQVA